MILSTENLQKTYGGPFQLGPVSVAFKPGETTGILGKNGAGKTTFFQLITGGLDASSGTIRFLDQKLVPESYLLKRQIGYLPQHLELPRWVTPTDILTYSANLQALADPKMTILNALSFWDCDWFAKRPLASCSHGMQKRVGLALATMHNPELLILDEPFSGLDLFHIKALEDTIASRRSDGKATIICTHIAPYAARICDQILLFNEGQTSFFENWNNSSQLQRIDLIEGYFFHGAQA